VTFGRVASLVLCACAVACGGYKEHVFDRVDAPGGGSASVTDGVRVPLGGVVKVHVIAKLDTGAQVESTLASHDPSILDIKPIITGPEDVVFLGTSVGKTQIDLKAAGKVEHTIDAEVYVPQ
jgi:hypothetical protein